MNEAYFVIKTPKWPMYIVLGISFLACVFAAVVFVIERIKKLYAPRTEEDESILANPELAILLGKEADDEK